MCVFGFFFSVEHVCVQSLQTTCHIPPHFPRHFNKMVQDSRGKETNSREDEDNREEHTQTQTVPDDNGKRALLSVIIPLYCAYCPHTNNWKTILRKINSESTDKQLEKISQTRTAVNRPAMDPNWTASSGKRAVEKKCWWPKLYLGTKGLYDREGFK